MMEPIGYTNELRRLHFSHYGTHQKFWIAVKDQNIPYTFSIHPESGKLLLLRIHPAIRYALLRKDLITRFSNTRHFRCRSGILHPFREETGLPHLIHYD